MTDKGIDMDTPNNERKEIGYVAAGRNPFYEGLFLGETEEMRAVRLEDAKIAERMTHESIAANAPVAQPVSVPTEDDDDTEEAREILTSMLKSIERDGNYSSESTCTFIRQALLCLPRAASRDALQAADSVSMTNGDFHCPACGNVMKGPTECGSCLWDADTCGYAYKALDSVAIPAAEPVFDFLAHLQRQREFSERTFGPGARTKGVVDHIRKELVEIEHAPDDLSEWADVVILALDGFWRAGATPQQIIDTIVAKQTKNEGRVWPDWRTADPNKAIEHDRAADAQRTDAEGLNLDFACFLIDHCEGETITEESIQFWLSRMMEHPRYAASPASNAQPVMAISEKTRMNLLLHADDMDVCGWIDDAKALRALLELAQGEKK